MSGLSYLTCVKLNWPISNLRSESGRKYSNRTRTIAGSPLSRAPPSYSKANLGITIRRACLQASTVIIVEVRHLKLGYLQLSALKLKLFPFNAKAIWKRVDDNIIYTSIPVYINKNLVHHTRQQWKQCFARAFYFSNI